MGLRAKILSGFLILSTMLLVAGIWSIYELSTIGISVQKILDDNYKSVNAAKSMIEALEREDSGILLLLLGKREEGRAIIDSADESFQKAYETARSNVTISGEEDYVNEVMNAYDTYRNLWRQSVVGTTREGDLNWYFRDTHSAFRKAKLAAQNLMTLNDQTMYRMASNLESRAHRATMPGVIAVASAFIFAIIFSFLINLFVVTPIIKLTDGIQHYLDSGRPLDVRIETKDELSNLVSSVEALIARSKQ
ncbi:MAG: MCP four helix bundle domain-containing protein [Syntrophales bacterium]|nr:MCP four helix bundle domain-containing protein [Syntrophales bacterium]